ncbi:hypothetical protein SDC9_67350 [bioreactor metagenome]|uniref:Uncharacterized protein n=1 Tax=bioreactor metagenome TaxID=1076179 RepID=A0A644XXD0_9ZZZZ
MRRHATAQDGRAQHHGHARHPELGDHEVFAAVQNVRQRAAGQAQQEHRRSRCGLHQRHQHGRTGQRGHQPSRGHIVHPHAGVGHDPGAPEHAEHRHRQRRERRLRCTLGGAAFELGCGSGFSLIGLRAVFMRGSLTGIVVVGVRLARVFGCGDRVVGRLWWHVVGNVASYLFSRQCAYPVDFRNSEKPKGGIQALVYSLFQSLGDGRASPAF